MLKTLIIDNFDSFTFNLVQYVGALGGNPVVFRNNAITIPEIEALAPTHIILSPGPGHPAEEKYFGICTPLLRAFSEKIAILGVCLGHQGIVTTFGGKVLEAPMILHGKTTLVFHNDSALFHDIPNPFPAMRYHSLSVDRASFPADLEITAATEDDIIMGLQHKVWPLFGIQFHPESVGTPHGKKLLANFLQIQK